ncbi:MAG: hypothetical protein OXE56_08290 [Gammaproteobacteria bacterium]|nr:hypothetical protein [Gammaproteobacteria bacterium]
MSKDMLRDVERDGYLFPLDVLNEQATAKCRGHLLAIIDSPNASKLGNRGQLNNLHVFSPCVKKINRTPEILSAVEQIIGADILTWSTSVFRKDTNSNSLVSWHQDLTYWGFNSDQEVSVCASFECSQRSEWMYEISF